MASAHVDDNGIMSTASWLHWAYNVFMKKFGDVTRQKLPLRHCGIDHEVFTPVINSGPRAGVGLRLHQQEFTKTLQPAPILEHRKNCDGSALQPSELTQLRAILGALLWLCNTRPDLLIETGEL